MLLIEIDNMTQLPFANTHSFYFDQKEYMVYCPIDFYGHYAVHTALNEYLRDSSDGSFDYRLKICKFFSNRL